MAVGPRSLIPKSLPKWSPVKKTISSEQESGASQRASLTGDFAYYRDSSGTSGFAGEPMSLGGNNQAVEASLSNHVVEEKDFIHMKLKELALNGRYGHANMVGHVEEDALGDDTGLAQNTRENNVMHLREKNVDSSFNPEDVHCSMAQVLNSGSGHIVPYEIQSS